MLSRRRHSERFVVSVSEGVPIYTTWSGILPITALLLPPIWIQDLNIGVGLIW
jgi:hypothetical protein